MDGTNLPHDVSTFLGRDAELTGLLDALQASRLVTLTGAGGVGKTRLALRAAHRRVGACRDGVWLIELAAVSQGAGVAEAVARVLGLREESSTPLIDTLTREVAGRDMLLVIDNCEHLLDASADLVRTLLQAAPGLRVLATSREAMGIRGEVLRPLAPLRGDEALALFTERARQSVPDFAPGPAEVETMTAIVQQLDGMPLAIELAAARTRMLSLGEILTGLSDRFKLMSRGMRGALAHQRTLEASVAWSYDLLAPPEQRLARRLSVLHGFTRATAEALAGAEPGADVLDLLARLVDKSLVQVDRTGPEPRFRFLETVRQYLLDRLRDSGEITLQRGRHLAHFLDLAEQLAPGLALRDGPADLARLEAEFGNLEDALGVADAADDKTMLLRLVIALSLFFELRGHLALGWRWYARALAAHPEVTVLRARALWGAAHVCFYGGRYAEAFALASEALEAATEVDDPWAHARALNTVGVLQSFATPIEARETLLQSVAIGRAIGDDWAVADGLKMVTVAWYFLHDADGAKDALDALEAAGTALESRFFLAWHQAVVGYFARDAGDLAAADSALNRSLAHSRHVGDPSTGGFAEAWSAALDADRGQTARARARLSGLLASAAVSGSDLAVPEALFALGQIAVGAGNPVEAVRLIGDHADALREAGVPGLAAQLTIVLAAAHCMLGNLDQADAHIAETEALVAPLKHPLVEGMVRFERARLAHARGAEAQAEDWLHDALDVQSAAGLRPGMIRTLEALAAALCGRGRPAEGARILSVTTQVRARIGLVPTPVEAEGIAARMAQAQDAIGAERIAELTREAVQADLADVVEYVSRARGKRGRPLSGWQSLTPTERRVVALATEGLTNPQIAERMFIARGTVKIHLSHVFDKLGVSSRTQLAALAVARQA